MSHPHEHDDGRRLRGLPAPVKNRYFYGMLLTDEVLRKDQEYFDGKRWLLNRLALGMGVLSGLDFDIPDGGSGGKVHLKPGVALDGFGREIVVPFGEGHGEIELTAAEDHDHASGAATKPAEFLDALDIKAPTTPPDPANRPSPTTVVKLLLQLAYDDELTDPQPVKAGHCATDCEPSSRREGFRLRVTKVEADPRHPDSTAVGQEPTRADGQEWSVVEGLARVFPQEPGEDVRHRGAAQAAGLAAPVIPAHDARWVPLGLLQLTVTWVKDMDKPPTLAFKRIGRYYRKVFSNDALSKLVFGLADRVDEAARVRVLTFDGIAGTSGNGQTAPVYQPLPKALKVKVVDSNAAKLLDPSSIRVRFEVQTTGGGMLSASPFVATNPYDPGDGLTLLDVGVRADGNTDDVYWRLSGTPGLHTVSARIIPLKMEDPPFHPGSQLAFHATAMPTAPTIIGVEFDDPWCLDDKCRKYEWTDRGEVGFRFVFSRKVEAVDQLATWFQAWAVYRFADGCIVAPTKLTFAELTTTAVCTGLAADSPEVIWQTEGKLTGLYHHLCPHDAVRIVIVGDVPSDAALASPKSDHYPNLQALDADFDGSFLSAKLRDPLFEAVLPDNFLTAWVGNGPRPTQLLTALPPKRHESTHPRAADDVEKVLRRCWDCFRPRERSLPTGDGTEGGEFHKTFEFHLPCGC